MNNLEVSKNMLICYHNDFNSFSIPGLTAQEMNVFYGICGRIKDTGPAKCSLTFNELRSLSGRTRSYPKDFEAFLINLNAKLVSIACKIVEENKDGEKIISQFNLFSIFRTNVDREILEVKLNEDFLYLLNALKSKYTSFKFYDFFNLENVYSKVLFRLLSQYKKTGFLTISVSEFKRILDIPESYKMKYIGERIITPAVKDLLIHFPELKVTKLANGKGKKITDLKFTFNKNYKAKEIDVSSKAENSLEGLSLNEIEVLYK